MSELTKQQQKILEDVTGWLNAGNYSFTTSCYIEDFDKLLELGYLSNRQELENGEIYECISYNINEDAFSNPRNFTSISELQSYLGKCDGYAVSDGENLREKYPTIVEMLKDAIDAAEEWYETASPECYPNLETFPIEIWSVKDIKVEHVTPDGEAMVEWMIDNYGSDGADTETFLEDAGEEQYNSLTDKINAAVKEWVEEEEIDFSYYNGVKCYMLHYQDVKNFLETEEKTA